MELEKEFVFYSYLVGLYTELVPDLFFDNSVFAIGFLDIEDYFADKKFANNEEKTLEKHFDELKDNQYFLLYYQYGNTRNF